MNALSLATLTTGSALWLVTLVGVWRGRGMTRTQRVITALVLLAAPVGAVVLLR